MLFFTRALTVGAASVKRTVIFSLWGFYAFGGIVGLSTVLDAEG